MLTILLVQKNGVPGDDINRVLTEQGWHVNRAKTAGEALRSAAQHAPNLVLVDGALGEAPSLLKSFSIGNGGPGAVVILPKGVAKRSYPGFSEADEALQQPLTAETLLELANRRLSTTSRKSESPRNAAPRGEVFNAQQIFGGILDELDEEESMPEPSKATGKVVRRDAPSPQPPSPALASPDATQDAAAETTQEIKASQKQETVAPKKAVPKVAASQTESSESENNLEERLNRAMTQALQVAEEVSSASVSLSQVDTFRNLDQEIEDQLAGVLSDVENPRDSASQPVALKSQAADPTPSVPDEITPEASPENAVDTIDDSEEVEAVSIAATESTSQSLDGIEMPLESDFDTIEESEEYETVGISSLLQKNKAVIIGSAAALILSVGLIFWFNRSGTETAGPKSIATPEQQDFQSEYTPPEEDDSLLSDETEDPELDSSDPGASESPQGAGTSSGSERSDRLESSETSGDVADPKQPSARLQTTPAKTETKKVDRKPVVAERTPLPAKKEVKEPPEVSSLSDQSSTTRSRPVAVDTSQKEPAKRPATQPDRALQAPARESASSVTETSTKPATQQSLPAPSKTTAVQSTVTQNQPRVTTPSARQPSSTTPKTTRPAQQVPQQAAPETKKPSPPKRTFKRGDLVRPANDVVAPILVNLPTAAYPTVAKKLKIEGNVTLSLLVDEDGRVQEVKVTKVPEKDRGFSEAAMKAARGARFEPATKGGIEVKYWHSVTIRFEL